MPIRTERISGLEQVGPFLKVQIGVSSPQEQELRQQGAPVPPPIEVQAVIDTGAAVTCIRPDLAVTLGLQPVNSVQVATASTSGVPCQQFLVRIQLSRQIIPDVVVTALPLPHPGIECLLGRNLLASAVLIYHGPEETFTLAF